MKNKIADIPYGGLNAYRINTAKPVFDEEVLEIFKHFVAERYKMHILKDVEGKPFPWTNDQILSMYRFTNVRREQDKNSKYLLGIMKEHGNKFTYDMLCNIMTFRLFNHIDTYKLVGDWIDFEAYDEKKVRSQLASAPKDHHYYTNAYMTSGTIRGFREMLPYKEEFKVMNIPNIVNIFGPVLYSAISVAESPQEVIDAFETLRGINDFIAYQLFVDLTFLDDFPWSENEFVLSGPGCSRGLRYLFRDNDGLSDEELLFWLRDNCPVTKEWCMVNMTDLPEYDRCMNVMSLENCMCELSKYMRAYYDTGRPRRLYKIGEV